MSTIDERRERASAGVALRDREEVWEDGFARPRVFLQPIAAPSVLGLAGFSVATMMVATIQAGWWGSLTDFTVIAPFCAMFGGLAQFAAGMWSYRARDVVATLAHGTWGAFWLAFGLLEGMIAAGVIPAPVPGATNLPLGLWFIGLAYITLSAAIAATAHNVGIAAVLWTLATGAALTAVGLLTGGFTSGWTHAGGWLFVISAGLAWYSLTAMMMAAVTGRTILPMGELKASANVPGRKPIRPIELEWAEPGVKQGQ
ncbi:MAG TPA: GPR1/FUN34/YaaH family transporter [Gaiellaceae bacterium]|nr:GPR1/FUN34/YaaH family transporter [Gaiellaceae bacterium]